MIKNLISLLDSSFSRQVGTGCWKDKFFGLGSLCVWSILISENLKNRLFLHFCFKNVQKDIIIVKKEIIFVKKDIIFLQNVIFVL